MLDLFSIISKGGIVLWYFQRTQDVDIFSPVNALIKAVILQERGGTAAFTHDSLALKYRMDNEFDLIYVIGFQKMLQLSYVDKFLDDISRAFRDRFKNELLQNVLARRLDFNDQYLKILSDSEKWAKANASQKRMQSYEESVKSKKTVGSVILENSSTTNRGDNGNKGSAAKKKKGAKKQTVVRDEDSDEDGDGDTGEVNNGGPAELTTNGSLTEEEIQKNLERLRRRNISKTAKVVNGSPKPNAPKERKKEQRQWAMEGSKRDEKYLDYSDKPVNGGKLAAPDTTFTKKMIGTMVGDLLDIDENENSSNQTTDAQGSQQPTGFFGMLKSLVSQKTLSRGDIDPMLKKMEEHLIGKNVASDIAEKLCDSVATKLEGKVVGTFSTITSTIRASLEESLTQILMPRRRIDLLRDAMGANSLGAPFVVTFCGVNGVGKSTNLAKICFWLIENNLRVLIAACDTFRAGAVEQLRTHCRHLNALHPPKGGKFMVQLYEKGYGKDPSGIAAEAIGFAKDQHFDVVLVDTAGRMQDNEPLMRALAKLIRVNSPDLVLFVGEALVGNEAVDQLVKFNQALADNSNVADPRLIDGIVLTKFDTIDDKVGAAVSMAHITGQPIVFVGTGQTYADLKHLNVKAVVNALMKP